MAKINSKDDALSIHFERCSLRRAHTRTRTLSLSLGQHFLITIQREFVEQKMIINFTNHPISVRKKKREEFYLNSR